MRNAECGVAGWVRGAATRFERALTIPHSALRIPHFALSGKPEVGLAAEASGVVEGRFGPYGGRYVPETLMAALEELGRVYAAAQRDPQFGTELEALLRDFVGRPTPLTAAPRLSAQVGGGV